MLAVGYFIYHEWLHQLLDLALFWFFAIASPLMVYELRMRERRHRDANALCRACAHPMGNAYASGVECLVCRRPSVPSDSRTRTLFRG